MKWDEAFRKYLKELDTKKPVVLTGDLNVAHEEIGIHFINFIFNIYFELLPKCQLHDKYIFRYRKPKN